MSVEFLSDDFLLQNKTAQRLYHDHAKKLPIIDYHCHLPVEEIANNKKFENITQIWLYGDHYKWRAMRTNGVDEAFCTGNKSDREKFQAWAETVPFTLRNPLYHWTHLELKKPFGIEGVLLNKDTAEDIWNRCNEQLAKDEFSTRGLLKQFNLSVVCTTDDPIDNLEHHQKIAKDGFEVKVLPAFRPDKGMMVESPEVFFPWLQKLQEITGIDITTFSLYLEAIKKRHDYFHANGCRVSDHGIETAYAEDYTQAEIEKIFAKLLKKEVLSEIEILKFKSAMLYEFAVLDHSKNWVQQFHMGALRNNNSRRYRTLGPDTGYDSIGDFEVAKPLGKLLDSLDSSDQLAKTILYNLNPRDNELLVTLMTCFQGGNVPGKLQFGSGWWFLDQKDGMEKQINALSVLGLLSRFVGMLTDSRSFLSYPRHEYFRRLLCQIVGDDVEKGLIPDDDSLIVPLIENICYYNAKNYFGF